MKNKKNSPKRPAPNPGTQPDEFPMWFIAIPPALVLIIMALIQAFEAR